MYYHNILLKEFKRIYTNGICHKNLLLEMLLTKVQFIVIAFSKSSAHLGWDVTTLCNPKKKDSLDIVTSALIITLTTITAKTKKKKKMHTMPCTLLIRPFSYRCITSSNRQLLLTFCWFFSCCNCFSFISCFLFIRSIFTRASTNRSENCFWAQ